MNNLFEILGVTHNEDVIVNAVSYLFENEEKFRDEFLKLMKVDPDNFCFDKDTKFILRKKYGVASKGGKRKYIIPDITIYDSFNDFLYVVEVKLDAEEGDNQLKDYKNNLKSMYKEFNDEQEFSEEKVKLYYLTIDDYEKEVMEVENLRWQDLKLDHICVDNPILESLYMLINPLNDIPEFSIEKLAVQESFGWQRLDVIIKEHIFDGREKNWIIDSFSGFDKNSQKQTSTIKLGKSEWLGKTIEKNSRKISFKESYDFHIEVQFSVDEEGKSIKVLYRFDLHTNPYKSKDQVKKYVKNEVEIADKYYSERKDFISKIIDEDKYGKDYGFVCNKRSRDYLYIFKFTDDYDSEKGNINFINDFWDKIDQFEEIGERIVKEFKKL